MSPCSGWGCGGFRLRIDVRRRNLVEVATVSNKTRYLLQEAILIPLLGYLVLLGGTFNGLVLYSLNQLTAILVGVISLLWLGHRLWRRQPVTRTLIDVPLLVFFAAYLIATIFSTDPGRSLGYVGLLAIYILAFYLVADLADAGWPAELFVKVLLVISTIVLFFGAWQIQRWHAEWFSIGGLAHLIPPATLRIRAFLGHPNFVAAFLNLLLPLALARMVESRARLPRLLLGAWVILALVLIYFTSSRGGWLGTAAALGTLVMLLALAHRQRTVRILRALVWPRWRPVALVVLIVAAIVAGAWLIARQSQHPTHGALADSRSGIWLPAVQAFVQHPLVGTGPFTYASTFVQANSVPPNMLLAHAHNYALNIAAETGLIGEAALLWLAVSLALAVWLRWRQAEPAERTLLAGAIASLAGIATHSQFDTPQTMPTINLVIAIVIGITLIRPANVEPVAPPRRTPDLRHLLADHGTLIISMVLFLAVMGGWVWSLRGYAPFEQGVSATDEGKWQEAATQLDLASERNPRLAYFHFQAGYAHGILAAGAPGPELDTAIQHYESGVSIEPHWATNLANLAVLYDQAGRRDQAIHWMSRAAALAPLEAAFPLNLGRYHEVAGDQAAAVQVYRRALDLRPVWSDLPFWRTTALRQQAVHAWRATHGGTSPVAWDASTRLETGWAALAAGQFEDARAFFAAELRDNDAEAYLGWGQAELALGHLDQAEFAIRSAMFMESPALIQVEGWFARGQIAGQKGNRDSAIESYEAALELLDRPTSLGPGTLGVSDYGWYVYNRASIAPDLLPGLMYPTLTDRALACMVELADWYALAGQRDRAAYTLRQVLEADPAQAAARQRLGTLFLH